MKLTQVRKPFCSKLFVCASFLFLIACDNKVEEFEDIGSVAYAKIYPSAGDTFNFAEKSLNLPSTGVCFSGGGTRAMVCAVGQMKGLSQLGLWDKIGYISCVSGGSWASVPFTYYNSGAANDEELLGTIISPGNLTVKGIDSLSSGFLAGAANADLLFTILDDVKNTAYDDLWIKGVGQSYMAPFGIYEDGQPKFFSLDTNTVNDIIERNPFLSKDDFLIVHDQPGDAQRPFLIVNASIVGPYESAPYENPEQLAVINYTPLYIGSANPVSASYTPEKGKLTFVESIGGGFIEPIGFASGVPATLPGSCPNADPGDNCVKLDLPLDTFSIARASGTSSSAFAADLTSHGIDGVSLKGLTPQENYYPISADSIHSEVNFLFGDGGNLENFGLISLLQRGVEDIVVFANSNVAINTEFDTSQIPTAKDVDSDFLPLFGIEFDSTSDQNQNQVFPESEFANIMQQFIDAKNAGTTVLATSSLTTVNNDWWGIQEGNSVDIVWVYNENVPLWRDSLEWEIKGILDEGELGLPPVPDFPLYRLIGEDLELVKLNAMQINLLYQLSAWNVYSNQDVFNDIYGAME